MKNQIKLLGIALLLVIGGSSCKKEENVIVNKQQPGKNLTNGGWVVTSYQLGGMEHADFYNGYTFTFEDNGTVPVLGTDPSLTGRWSTTTMNNWENLSLDFGTRDPFSLLNHSYWKITSQSMGKIELRSTRGDDSEQSLTLTKK
jgi:hypothetical protein